MIITTLTIAISIYSATIIILNKKEAKEFAPTNIVNAELKALHTKYAVA